MRTIEYTPWRRFLAFTGLVSLLLVPVLLLYIAYLHHAIGNLTAIIVSDTGYIIETAPLVSPLI